MAEKPNLFMFDLSSNFSRNYFKVKKAGGIPQDGMHRGVPVFAVKSTVFQVLKEVREVAENFGNPTHLLLTLDHDGDTFRHEIYPDYKANRPEKEDDFYIQRYLVHRVFELLGIACISREGFEADDILATIATKMTQAEIPTVIFTKDKDLLALVSDVVTIYNGQEGKYFDHGGVIEAKGVPPSRITDMLVLEGDVADNIIGVKGVGKTTSKQILELCSLKELMDNPDVLLDTKVRGKANIVKYIKENADFINLMTQVATMRVDVELGSNLREWQLMNFPYTKYDAFNRVESAFNYAVNELLGESN